MTEQVKLNAPDLAGAAAQDGTKGIPVTPQRPVDTSAYQPIIAAGKAQQEAEQVQRDTSVMQSVEAAVGNWDTTALLYDNKPDFAGVKGYSPTSSINAVQFPLDDAQRSYLSDSASPDEFSWKLQQLTDQNQRAAAIGAHPWVAGAVSMADPIYLASDLLSAGAVSALQFSRVGRAVAGAVGTAATMDAAGDYRPVTPEQMLWGAALAGAGTFIFPGGHVADPVEQAAQLAQEELMRSRRFLGQRYRDMSNDEFLAELERNASWDRLQGIDTAGQGYGLPGAMAGFVPTQPGAVTEDVADAAAGAATGAPVGNGLPVAQPSLTQRAARFLSWSRYGALQKVDQSLADRLLADPLQPTTNNAAVIFAEQEGRSGRLLGHAEDAMQQAMLSDGWNAARRVTDPNGWVNAQKVLEGKVQREIEARTADPNFRGRDDTVNLIADRYGKYSQAVARDLEDVGLVEPGFANANPYYYARRWDGDKVHVVEQQLGDVTLRAGLAAAIRSRTPHISQPVAEEIAGAIVRRAKDRRLGLGLGMQRGGGLLEEALEELRATGGSSETIAALNNALSTDTGPTMLRRRIDMDTAYEIAPGIKVHDLFDSNILNSMRGYNRRVSGQIALTRVGLGTAGERAAELSRVADAIPDKSKRAQAVEAIQQAYDFYTGEGSTRNSSNLRDWNAYNAGVSLGMSGLGQMIEFGTTMAEHGAVNTFRALLRSSPEARALVKGLRDDKPLAEKVTRVLSESVANSVTLRPALTDIEREAGFMGNNIGRLLEQANDARVAINGEQFFRARQTALNTQLVWEAIRDAAAGDAKAASRIKRFGATDDIIQRARQNITQHGDDLDSWDYATRRDVGAVVINNTRSLMSETLYGGVPAWMDDKLGKFLGTFMRFVVGAHNAVLARTLNQRGVSGIAALLAYQFPLAMLQQYARDTLMGKAQRTPEEVAKDAMGQMSGLGLLSEAVGVLGDGGRGLGGSGINGARKLLAGPQHAANAVLGTSNNPAGIELSKSLGGILSAVPLIGAVPGVRALTEALKDAKPQ